MTVTLPGGYELRVAREGDLDQVCALLAARGEENDARDLRLVIEDEGLDGVAVVLDGARVVSTATLLDETVHVGDVALPTGQVELVATDVEHEGRGLVRALMGWAHELSAARGHVLQLMVGIPYFYRRFGYEYALPQAPWSTVPERPVAPDGVTVRRATLADIPAMAALSEHPTADVRMPRSPHCWRWLVERDGSEQLVAERAGTVVGSARSLPDDEDPAIGEVGTADADAAVALVAHAWRPGLTVQRRAGTVADAAIAPLTGGRAHDDWWYYARVPDLATVLRALAPVLSRRLLDAGHTAERELVISSFAFHVRLALGPDGVRGVTAGGTMQSVGGVRGSAVPPDALASLLLGPHGAAGLAERLPDCYLLTNADVMTALFPPVTSDVMPFYLPT